ncbi:hypothetical protein S245_011253 [Arachis hypogaea]
MLDLVDELFKARDDYKELENSVTEGIDEMVKNLKAQFRILTPEVDLFLISADNTVVDGKIVPAPEEDKDTPMSDLKMSGLQVEGTYQGTTQTDDETNRYPPKEQPLPSKSIPSSSARSEDVIIGAELHLL